MVTCGIDWAQDHHDIAIVDAEGRLVATRRIPESVAGFGNSPPCWPTPATTRRT